jgi:cobaltochelatase CobN
VRTSNTTFQEFVGLSGYGLAQPVDGAVAQTTPAAPAAAAAQPQRAPVADTPLEPQVPPLIEGMKLEKVAEPVVQALSAMLLFAMGLLLMTPAIGAWRQWRKA